MKRRPSFNFTDQTRLKQSVEEFGRWVEDELKSLAEDVQENRKAAIAALAENDKAVYAISKRLTELSAEIRKLGGSKIVR
ncbi:hypothetical protein [Candidatus Binatus sp.]|uniref:hypothetical protein n=1 Tax=Candidatus Binatus sp. TaxID=2811406 RepID=UPI003C6A5F06